MSELIKREDAIKEILRVPPHTDPYKILVEVWDRIKALPTIDAVHVVRCEDCRYCYYEGERNEKTYCTEHPNFGNLPTDWFCPDGMRREEQEWVN